MSLSDNRDYIIEEVENVHPNGSQSRVPEQKYTGTIPKNTSSPPSSTMKLEHLPPNFKSVVERINTGDRVCVIMRGLPGSGKSSLAQQIIEETVKNAKDHIVSADNFFMQRGVYRYDSSKIEQAHNEAQQMFAQKASLGYSPLIVDNTNVEYWHMLYYLQVAVQYHYHVEILEPSTPWKFKDNMLAVKNVHGVPIGSIKNMKSKYETGISLNQLFNMYNLKAVQVPKKRDVPKFAEMQSSNPFKNVDFANFESKPGSSGFQPIKESREVQNVSPKANEYQQRGLNAWEGLFSVPNQNAPSPDSTTAEDTTDGPMTPKGKNRKNKKNKTKLVPHRANCPNENQSFSAVRDLYPKVNDTHLWDLFVKCQGNPDWTVSILMDENKTEQMTSGNELTCTCFTFDAQKSTKSERKEDSTIKRESPPSSAKKTKQELKQNELLNTKAAIEQSIKFAPEHYPDHVNKVKEWRTPQVPSVEDVAEPMVTSRSPDLFGVEDELKSLIVSPELVLELDELYGGGLMKNLMKEEDFKLPPQYFVRTSVAHDFYMELMNCFFSQQEEKRLSDLHKDEELAKALQEQEEQKAATNLKSATKKDTKQCEIDILNGLHSNRIDEWGLDDSSEESLARKMSKEKLIALFPNLQPNHLLEIWKSNKYDYLETVEMVKDSLFCTIEERDTLNKKQKEIFNTPWEQKPVKQPEVEGCTKEQLKTVDDLREEINDHLEETKACNTKAQEAIRSKKYEVASYYSNIAQFHELKRNECNHELTNLLSGIHESQLGSSKTLDLHYFNSIEALTLLDTFLDKHISTLRSIKKPHTDVFIITGKGNNSVNGIPVIKNKTKIRLNERKLTCQEINPGYLGVRINHNSLLSQDI